MQDETAANADANEHSLREVDFSTVERRLTAGATEPAPACEVVVPTTQVELHYDPLQMETIVRTVPGGAGNVQDVYPLSPLQEGMLFHRLVDTKHDSYVLCVLFEVQTSAQLGALIAALQKVVDRHDVLRTAVLWEGLPQAVQVVYRRAVLPVEKLVLARERDALEQLHEEMSPVRHQLDLGRAPVLQLQVADHPVQLAPRHYAILRVHHLLCDHQSLRLVVEEALHCLAGREEELPATAPFREHVVESRANDIAAAGAEQFFREGLAGVDEPTAPFGVLDVRGHAGDVEEATQTLDPRVAAQVRAQARRLGVSPARLFHAAWALVVARTSGRDDVVFGTVLLAARQRGVQLQRMLGMSVNTLPLRMQLQGLTAKELVESTQRELTSC